jgi:hypothetical protein
MINPKENEVGSLKKTEKERNQPDGDDRACDKVRCVLKPNSAERVTRTENYGT